mmetsp:Transcript_27126/g.23998  ORF Transcript_27126/g.23998 Transcript_27126/m.23998 type:complete len:137 (+) Transcript_27126:133-543(+)
MKVLKINVGGRIYTTTFETLTSVPGSRLSEWFKTKDCLPKDENNIPFIDRDPDLFAPLLDYLRSDELPENMTDRLSKEFLFYGIVPEMRWGIEKRMEHIGTYLRVSKDGEYISKGPFNTFSLALGQKRFYEGCFKW